YMNTLNAVEGNPNAVGLDPYDSGWNTGYTSYGYSYANTNTSSYGSYTGIAGGITAPTVGLVIPGQLAATMIQSGSTGSSGDPFLQEQSYQAVDPTGEDLAGLVKGFLDDSRMRSDAGSTAWWRGSVRIETPFDPSFTVQVGTAGPIPQGLPTGL